MTREQLIAESEARCRRWQQETFETTARARTARDRALSNIRVAFRNELGMLRCAWGDERVWRFVQKRKDEARRRLAEERTQYDVAERAAWTRYNQLSSAERERLQLQIGEAP